MGAVDSTAGLVPEPGALEVAGLHLAEGALEQLLTVDPDAWSQEADQAEEFFARLAPADRVALTRILDALLGQ